MENYAVVIVGYGPTGLTMASLLGQSGHKVLVVEKWPELYGMARLTHIDGETVRLLSFASDIDDAMRDSSPIKSYKFLNAKGKQLLDVSSVPTTPMGHPAHNSIYQPHIEDALNERVKSCANVTVLQGYELIGLEQHPDAINLEYRGPDGKTDKVTARFVFGSDGANSFVRNTLGISSQADSFDEHWLNVDGILTSELPDIYKEVVQHCDPARGHMSMPIGKGRHRFEFGLLPHEEPIGFDSEENVRRLLKKHYGVESDGFQIERKIVYQFHSKMADTWQRGNVLLGGDAAHTMPPYLGQGACSGIRDSANLAWKLDLVLRGKASDDLLTTYDPERRPHVAYIQKTAVSFGKVANTHNKVQAFIRDIIMPLNILPAPAPFPPLGLGIKQPTSDKLRAKYIGGVPPHGRVEIDGETKYFDTFSGYNFSLIGAAGTLASLTGPQRTFLDDLGCRLFEINGNTTDGILMIKDTDGIYSEFLTETKSVAMLLRPDTNLFGLAQLRTGVATLVDQLQDSLGWKQGEGA